MRGGEEPIQQTEQGTIEPDGPFWHHLMDHIFEIIGGGTFGLIMCALIGVWGNRALKKRRKAREND